MADASANVFGGRVPLPFEAMRRRAQLNQQKQDSTNYAEMGAAQLEQYGPDGQVWAQRLRTNPREALAMAEAYGGFPQIEFGLRQAASAGQGAATQSAQRQATAQDLLQTFGPQAVQQFGSGQKALADVGEAEKSGLNPEGARWFGKNMLGLSKNFDVQRGFYRSAVAAANEAAKTNDPKKLGASDFALVQAMGKLIDPTSVVRNEEGRFIQEAGESDLGSFLQRMQRKFGTTGVLGPQARLSLINQLTALYGSAKDEYTNRYDRAREQSERIPVEDEFLRELMLPASTDPYGLEEVSFSPAFAEAASQSGPVSADQSFDTWDAFKAADIEPGVVVRDPDGDLWTINEQGETVEVER